MLDNGELKIMFEKYENYLIVIKFVIDLNWKIIELVNLDFLYKFDEFFWGNIFVYMCVELEKVI